MSVVTEQRANALAGLALCAGLLVVASMNCSLLVRFDRDLIDDGAGGATTTSTSSSSSSSSGGGTGGSGGSGCTGGGPGCTGCGPLEECHKDHLCVAKLVEVGDGAGGGGFSIDATEVTRSQYQAWLATCPSTDGQDPWCSWNTSFAPDGGCMASNYVCHTDCSNHPHVCVDWCDAYAYCKAVGKRLCGRIGGGPNGYSDYANASLSQWYNACSSNGVNDYPYGDSYDGDACNGYEWVQEYATVEVGSLPGCQSSEPGYDGVFDLSGNVWEWEDSCAGTGEHVRCNERGGSFLDDMSASLFMRCDYDYDYDEFRDVGDVDLGFRCCVEPTI